MEETFQRYNHKPAEKAFSFGNTILHLAIEDNVTVSPLTCSFLLHSNTPNTRVVLILLCCV